MMTGRLWGDYDERQLGRMNTMLVFPGVDMNVSFNRVQKNSDAP